ncbi:MAG: tetratricopeptide repeat protein [Tannerella sp.]|jgi:hypothetical protein|nr:tetratricopeptide repeat protein [Tannerella sp.]
MKRACLFFAVVSTSVLLFSCRSYRVIEVETYNPATITFPPEIKTVMIVNNSAQQPDHVGHRFSSYGKSDSLLSVSADSMAYHFCMSLGKAIAESPLFYDVRICEDTLRRDSHFYNSRPFTADEVVSFCNDYEVDALIILDKLFFNTVFYETDMKNLMMGNGISAKITGELRTLWPGQKAVYSIPFSDSLVWYMDENFLYEDVEVFTTSDVRYAIQYLSEWTGRQMHVHFVPFWSDDKRCFYTDISSQWKQATAYAVAGKWAEAAEIWEPMFVRAKKWQPKARLASNLALCYEMTSNFDKAVEYAEISDGLFKEFASDSAYVGVQSAYLDILKKRVTADQILSEQLREK